MASYEHKADAPGLLEEERRGRGRKTPEGEGGSGRAWKGTISDRVLVTRKLPQAVLKITGHGNGMKSARRLVRYVGEQGETPVELDDGSMLYTKEDMDQLAADWSADFSTRANSRDVMHVVVSVPSGTDKAVAQNAAREFFSETFAVNHEYAFAAHDETDNFHIHLLVKMRGRDGKQLRSTRKDPDLWRQGFAAKAREHGLMLDASPRRARGKGRKSSPPTAVYELRKRGEVPEMDSSAAAEALARVRESAVMPNEFEQTLREINLEERLEFAKHAKAAIAQAQKIETDADRVTALEIAADLAVHAETMPIPKTRMELLMESVKPGISQADLDLAEVRGLTKEVERSIRNQIGTFSDPALQRRAIGARARLSEVFHKPVVDQEQDR